MNALLLHTCCAPCITVPLEKLKSEFEVTSFYYNPNIYPKVEHDRRLDEIKKWTDKELIPLVTPNYDSSRWFEQILGLEAEPEGGKRCAVCFRMRLTKTACVAKEKGINYFATTLTISPHKNAQLINQIGSEIASQLGVKFLAANFKKQDGFKRSVELSKKYNFYRQDYCGCIFSLKQKS